MHQIPLHLMDDPHPGAPECATMSMVLTPRNLIECELFVKVLKMETHAVFTHFAEIAPRCFAVAKEHMKNKDPTVLKLVFQLMNEIICRAPSGTHTFVDAILARSIHYMKNNRYLVAAHDLRFYDSLDPKLKNSEGIIISRILSCVSLFLAGDYHGAKANLANVKKLIDVASYISLLVQYEEKIRSAFSEEIQIKHKIRPILPFKGCKLTRKIPFASGACAYLSKNAGVFATSDIDKGEIVLAENPTYFQFGAPFNNCDLCGVPQELIYTCAGCRYKTYCSESCMKDDEEIHHYECSGYKVGIIPMMESTTLFRLFLKSAEYIEPALEDFVLDGGLIKSAKEAWNFILEHAKEEEKEYNLYGDLLSNAPDYKRLSKENYLTIITKSFRLAVYIYNDVKLIDKYFNMLTLKKEDMITVIGSILLRLAAHVVFNSHHEKLAPFRDPINEVERSLPVDDLKTKTMRMEENAFSYYGIDAVADFVNCYNSVQKSFRDSGNSSDPCMPLETPICQFTNKLLSLCLNRIEVTCAEDIINANSYNSQQLSEKMKNMNTSKRCHLLENYTKHFQQFVIQYFTRGKLSNRHRQVKSSFCTTLKSFRHYCGAENVKVICMSSGNFIGVTTKKIKSGSELVVCSDYIRNSAHSTSCVEQGLGYNFPLYVHHENHTVSNVILILFLNNYDNVLDVTVQHDLSVLYGAYNSFLTLHFPDGHPMRLLGVLKFSMFLATNGFLEHSSYIIMHIIEVMESDDTYFEDIELYRQTFCIIQSIMEQYIDIMIDCPDIDPGYPVMLLGSCWCFLRRLMHQVEKLKDEEGSALYAEYCTYHHKWKLILNSYIQMPSDLKEFMVKLKT
ncbi:hypothetical protein KR067_011821 [Drosophila pandora]|nr:hypothetical protein KR067_011821 [Drosophila pandora]